MTFYATLLRVDGTGEVTMRKRLKAYLPTPSHFQNNRYLRVFERYLSNPNLWHFHRRSVATAASIGLFITYLPIPGHTFLAALLAISMRANLAVSIVLSWFVNPVTFVPLFGLAYSIGAWLMGIPFADFHFEWQLLRTIWPPLLLGCLICATALAIAGNLGVRLFWRYSVAKAWKNRHQRRKISLPPHFG